jgi:hypothetical protein
MSRTNISNSDLSIVLQKLKYNFSDVTLPSRANNRLSHKQSHDQLSFPTNENPINHRQSPRISFITRQ